MTLRIETLLGDEIEPLPDEPGESGEAGEIDDENSAHIEDRLLGRFAAFLARRGARRAERALGASLLLAAIEQVADLESGWERLALPGCIARVAAGPRPLAEREQLTALARELVHWLRSEGRLPASARRRLLRQLAPEPRPAAPPRTRLAA